MNGARLEAVSSVQFSHSVVCNTLQPHALQHARLPCPPPTSEVAQIHVHQVGGGSNHLIFSRPLLLLPSIFPSIKVFSSELVLHIRWPKYWSFSFSISPSNDYSGLISFRMDWFDLLKFKELSRVFSNTTVLKHQFFGVQLSL